MAYSASLEASLALYQEGKYGEAYDLITAEASSPDAIPALVYYLRFSFATRAGMPDLAMDLLREAVLDKGYWFSNDYLDDDDLEPLRTRAEFQEMLKICRERQENARKTAAPDMMMVPPHSSPVSETTPMVVALHGNQLNMHTTRINWGGKALSDCLLVLPQSSYAVCSGAYSWPDPMAGAQDVILGGFSAGGRSALHAVVKGVIQAKGLILVGPWLPDIPALEPMLPNLAKAGVRTYLICGDRDRDCYDSTNRLAEMLGRDGVTFHYQVVKGMGHHYPDDFDEELGKARSFILGE
jgi:hypothetical protein